MINDKSKQIMSEMKKNISKSELFFHQSLLNKNMKLIDARGFQMQKH